MEDRKYQIHEDGNAATLTINTDQPVSWVDVIVAFYPFLRCHSGCFGDAATGKLVQLNRPSERQKINTNPPEPVANESSPSILSLPVDMFLRIFEHMAPPYELEANLCFADGYHRLLALPFPRTWKSMKIFHISKVFRKLAIHFYGEPCESSLPFNSRMDKLVITDIIPFHHLNQPRSQDPVAPLCKDCSKRLWIVRNGIHYYKLVMYSTNPDSAGNLHPTQCFPEFFELVRRLDFTALSKPCSLPKRVDERDWGRILYSLSRMFERIETISVRLPRYDNCCAKDEHGATPKELYKTRDMTFLWGFYQASLFPAVRSLGPIGYRFFPKLRHLGFVRMESVCSEVAYFDCDPEDVNTEHLRFDPGAGEWSVTFYFPRIESLDT
ncbi:hypothetical protein F4776DRAFT_668035 [Hypoxylon sp. NC0597]|nr:hypothetical protein F4776DRAFT_668035 [Hypoxylon sp. NC0597]